MPKVSVIIPVYNTAPYLRRCLDSVVGQTLRDIEIICVNDGSTDESGEILQEYAEQDDRIRIIYFKENKGVSVARNAGIEITQGEYLGFVDSDDYPELNFYEKLYSKIIINNADVAKGNYRYWSHDGNPLPIDYSLNERIREFKTNFSFAFCSAIYKRKLIFDNKINFPIDQIDIEDPIFSLKVALLCNRIEIIDNAVINIVINKSSSTCKIPDIKRIFSKLKGLSKIIDIINTNNIIEKKSYAFIVAFWFKIIVEASTRNKTELAYRIMVANVYDIFKKVKFRNYCASTFEELSIYELFLVLKTEKIVVLSGYIVKFYDERKFKADYVRFLSQKQNNAQLMKVSIAIPIYSENPNNVEIASLRQCLKILGRYKLTFFCPEDLDTYIYGDIAREYRMEYTFEKFPEIYFDSQAAYSQLLLDIDFYSRFVYSEYLLVYQLGSWVFRDELTIWCDKDYDYIGAPWFEETHKTGGDSVRIDQSGSGKFSLRKIQSFLKCLRALEIKMFTDTLYVNDIDAILSIKQEDRIIVKLFPKIEKDFKIAPTAESIYFSFEVRPEHLYTITHNLPFGCHGFTRYNPEFWYQYINLSEHCGKFKNSARTDKQY
jgi:glycosyltransferase involved in cell wall biosynthesis